jgi:hypothetical protein
MDTTCLTLLFMSLPLFVIPLQVAVKFENTVRYYPAPSREYRSIVSLPAYFAKVTTLERRIRLSMVMDLLGASLEDRIPQGWT